jgi:uncharacterized protein (DUF779 family)
VPEIRADQTRAAKIHRSGGCCPGDTPEPLASSRKARNRPQSTCCPDA